MLGMSFLLLWEGLYHRYDIDGNITSKKAFILENNKMRYHF